MIIHPCACGDGDHGCRRGRHDPSFGLAEQVVARELGEFEIDSVGSKEQT